MRVNRQPRRIVFVFLAVASAFVPTSCYAAQLTATGGAVEKRGSFSADISLFGNTNDGQPFSFSAAASNGNIPQSGPYSPGAKSRNLLF